MKKRDFLKNAAAAAAVATPALALAQDGKPACSGADFSTLVRARHSVRDFLDKPVDEQALRDIVSDAQQAPSWVNAQEWKVYAATGETLAAFRRDFQARAASGEKGASDIPPAHRTSWSQAAQKNMQRLSVDVGAHMGKEAGVFAQVQDTLFNAPALLFFTLPKEYPQFALLDLGGFYQTLMLAATARGIDSIPAYAIVKYPDLAHKHLGIPASEIVAIGVALGYKSTAKINSFRTTRVPLDAVLNIKK